MCSLYHHRQISIEVAWTIIIDSVRKTVFQYSILPFHLATTMTEKSIKNQKNKNKHLKIKKTNVQQQQKVFESDSDISEPDNVAGKLPSKMGHQALNKISSEVTDLLASLKKEHGIDDDDNNNDDNDESVELKTSPPGKKDKKKFDKVNKIKEKKCAAIAKNVLISEVKKLQMDSALGHKLPKQQNKSKKMNANQKLKPTIPVDDNKMELDDTSDNNMNEARVNSPKKKKNKKRAAATALVADNDAGDNDDDDEKNTNPSQIKKMKTTPNQNQKQKVKREQLLNVAPENGNQPDEANVKKDHHLKNAVPIYVGNLPKNIKRLKLVKMFKKFGKILSIRFRTNSGKSFFKKAQVAKAPFLIAFIFFETREAAEASLVCNGTQIGDNVITVDLDADKRVEVKHPPKNTVVVGNLKYAVTDQILRDAFKCCGQIEHIRILQSLQGCKGMAFIQFTKPESCELALKLHGIEILNREMRVERYKANKKETKIKKEKMPKSQKRGKAKKNASNTTEAGGYMEKKMQKTKNKAKTVKEFMGTKSVDNKKTLNKKKKKNKLSAEKRLAQKVAPKSEKASSA